SCRQPIALVESGPIGGCIGAGVYAEALGFKNVIAFDMGGTTAKCALVEEGRFSVDSIYYAGGYVQGVPIKSAGINNRHGRSRGSISSSGSMSGRRAPARRPARSATAAEAPRPP